MGERKQQQQQTQQRRQRRRRRRPLVPALAGGRLDVGVVVVVVAAAAAAAGPGGVAADGDLARQYYLAHAAKRSAPPLALGATDLPASVQKRLLEAGVDWAALSGLLQRAVLWDQGFVFVTPTKLAQVYTSCSRTMADLHVDRARIERARRNATDCAIEFCGQMNGFLSAECPPDLVHDALRCIVNRDDLVDATALPKGVYWAEDGRNGSIPAPVLRRHATRGAGGAQHNLYAIHMTDQNFVGLQDCQLRGDIIIPCRDRDLQDTDACEPLPSTTVDAWLANVAAAREAKTFSAPALVVIGVLGTILLALVAGILYLHKTRRRHAHDDQDDKTRRRLSTGLFGFDPLDSDPHILHGSMDIFEAHARAEGGGGSGRGGDDDPGATNDALCARSRVLQRFVTDPTIVTKRIAFSQLNFLRVLSKGANGEVWLGQFESRYVAMKCLLPTKRKDLRALEQFSEEIRLASSLEHPRIVTFCGIAWHSLRNLSIVTEYMEKGDLENLLAQPTAPAQLSWAKEKLVLAKDIADALVYLHSLVPVTIHRDLKSKNILLDAAYRAKLSDFGLSRATSADETMTNGVGTILWSAPEVLEGKRYDEKADIFSYGIVLSEIDTCALPYGFNNRDPSRNKMKSMQIVHLVAEGKLLPTFRDDCPPSIVALARSCLDLDPAQRPSAMQVVFTLRSKVFPALHRLTSSMRDDGDE